MEFVMDISVKKILIIEDDRNIVDLAKIHIRDLGYETDSAGDGESGLNKALGEKYALIILDIMLPKMDGLEVCRRFRQNDQLTPVLMLTAKSEELDKVLGLELGADDYLTKPFSVRELVARIKAILRRIETERQSPAREKEPSILDYDKLVIDTGKRKVTLSGEKIELTAKEFDLLVLFASHPGRTYNRQQLLDLVWGYHFDGYDHTVNSHINRLRSKIERDPSRPDFIRTVWGVGYRFAEKEELGL
jgi:two-component system alkaline phosphatase synthesis response regulator PhoP